MRLPNGDKALVEETKLQDYVLNPQHPVGRHHAVLFEQLLGIDRARAQILRQALLVTAAERDVSREMATPFGRKYEMRFEMEGPAGTKTVLAVWIIETGSDRPRLVTCYVE